MQQPALADPRGAPVRVPELPGGSCNRPYLVAAATVTSLTAAHSAPRQGCLAPCTRPAPCRAELHPGAGTPSVLDAAGADAADPPVVLHPVGGVQLGGLHVRWTLRRHAEAISRALGQHESQTDARSSSLNVRAAMRSGLTCSPKCRSRAQAHDRASVNPTVQLQC